MTSLERRIVNIGFAILNAPSDKVFFQLVEDMNHFVRLRHRLDSVEYVTIKLNRHEVSVRLKAD